MSATLEELKARQQSANEAGRRSREAGGPSYTAEDDLLAHDAVALLERMEAERREEHRQLKELVRLWSNRAYGECARDLAEALAEFEAKS